MTTPRNSLASCSCHCPGCKKSKELAPATSHDKPNDQILFKQLENYDLVASKRREERDLLTLPTDAQNSK